jgi:glycosyltransferase involved in cell wall biosynthesis
MRLLLINQFFHPDHSAVAQIASDLAEDLVALGHQVTVVAARGAYLGGAGLPARETWQGVEIIRVGGTSFGKRTLPGRIADYLSFYVAAAARTLLLKRFDAVIATTAPPLVAVLGALLKGLKGSRFVYWLQDLYPELAIEFGVLAPGSLAARGFERLSRFALRRADAVVVLGDAMSSKVQAKGVPLARIHVIPNWADGKAVRPVSHESSSFRRQHGLDGRTVVLYSGNMGRGHDMRTILDAARLLCQVPNLVFAFIGDGARRGEVEAACGDLPNVRLFPYQPREQLHDSLSAGDIHVVSQEPATLGLIEPSKLYGVLAAGRPMLYIGPPESEAARTVLEEGIGEVVAPGDAAGAARAIVALATRSQALGARARATFELVYDRPHRTRAFHDMLQALAIR